MSTRDADSQARPSRWAARVFLLVLAALGAGCAEDESAAGYGGSSGPTTAAAPGDPIDFGTLPDFRLTDQHGEPFGLIDLKGTPWVLACIFTTCTGPCPSITRTMADVARRLEGTEAHLVSITVDPARDNPAVLDRYAQAHEADPERWSFLTGEEAEVHGLIREGFKLPVAKLDEADPETGDFLTHDRRLTVVDAEGRIRGWYDSEDPAQVKRLVERVRALLEDE
ncbi:MAG: SCO family protein [Planctomycetota bacterium]